MGEPEPLREDLKAALSARRDLGPDYEDAVLESFLERVDASVAARVDARLAAQLPAADRGEPPRDDGRDQSFVLGIISLGTGIPITAIASSNGGVAGTVAAWVGIALVNVAYSWGRRPGG